jgi:regulator of RNase E activity RraA
MNAQVHRPSPSPEVAKIQNALADVSTSMACDILKPHNPDRFVFRGVRPVNAVKSSVSGIARTLRFLPGRSDIDQAAKRNLRIQQVDSLNPGDVLVFDQMRGFGGPIFGEMVSLRAYCTGAAAVVTDGAVRDTAAIAEVGLSLFASDVWPAPTMVLLIPWETDVPIQCGGALVMPGDWILGDNDAVMVIPKTLLPILIERLDVVTLEESFCRRLLQRGHSLKQAYPLPERLRPLFERFKATGDLPSEAEIENARILG